MNFWDEVSASSLHVVVDFDGTLAVGPDGSTPSLISLLRNGPYLDDSYRQKAHALYDKYYPFEQDASLSLLEKSKLMTDWWIAHNELLVASGLRLSDLRSIATSNKLKLRDGVQEFFALCQEKNIPILIFSASGCGDAIAYFLEHNSVSMQGVHIVSNHFTYDDEGNAIALEGPVIHSVNKNEDMLPSSLCSLKKNRPYALVIGDSIHDAHMTRSSLVYRTFIGLSVPDGWDECAQDFIRLVERLQSVN